MLTSTLVCGHQEEGTDVYEVSRDAGRTDSIRIYERYKNAHALDTLVHSLLPFRPFSSPVLPPLPLCSTSIHRSLTSNSCLPFLPDTLRPALS